MLFGGAGGRGWACLGLQNLQILIKFSHALLPFGVGANIEDAYGGSSPPPLPPPPPNNLDAGR